MIDFSTLQGLTIPEGVVTQIADASGRVLWSAAKPVTVTIRSSSSNQNSKFAHIIIDGQTYDGSAACTISVPVGTIVTCYASSQVFLNGTAAGGSPPITYEHEITTNTDFDIQYNFVGWVDITES